MPPYRSVGPQATDGPDSRPLAQFFGEQLRLQPGGRCLDAGCGSGVALEPLWECVHPAGLVIGIDVDEELVAQADERSWLLGRVRILVADAHQLPFADATFDAAYASLLLLWVTAPAAVITELKRVTRPGGRIGLVDLDLSPMRFEPDLPSWSRFSAAVAAFQRQHGFDGEIGRRLYGLCHKSGLDDIQLQARTGVATQTSASWAAAFTIVAGPLAHALVAEGFMSSEQLASVIGEASERMRDPAALFVGGTTYAVSGQVPQSREPER